MREKGSERRAGKEVWGGVKEERKRTGKGKYGRRGEETRSGEVCLAQFQLLDPPAAKLTHTVVEWGFLGRP